MRSRVVTHSPRRVLPPPHDREWEGETGNPFVACGFDLDPSPLLPARKGPRAVHRTINPAESTNPPVGSANANHAVPDAAPTAVVRPLH